MNLKSFTTISFLLLALVNGNHLNSQSIDKTKIEQEYIAKARQNIEQYRKGNASILFVDSQGKPLKNIKVEINQVSQDFLFGNLGFDLIPEGAQEPYKVDEFKKKFKALFNFAIIPFYWSGYEPKAGHPEWQMNEAAIDWCLENGITCKGHPLGWTHPSGTPKWLLKLPADAATDIFKARIYENVIGYKGRIDIWDVVNEPIHTVSWETALKDTVNSDDTRYISNEFIPIEQIAPWIEDAFKWADNANPDGNYILNEFNTLAKPEARDRFYQLIKELLQRNTPVKGIGIQAHEPRSMWFSPVEIYATLDKYKEFNMPIHITEFVVPSAGQDISGWRDGKWNEEMQAEFAEQFYTLAFGYPSIVSINWWGFSDSYFSKNNWLLGGGLLDNEYNPKPVYTRLLKLIKEDWMTQNVKLESDKKGLVNFRGFYGKYEVKISNNDGSSKVLNIHLSEKDSGHWEFIL